MGQAAVEVAAVGVVDGVRGELAAEPERQRAGGAARRVHHHLETDHCEQHQRALQLTRQHGAQQQAERHRHEHGQRHDQGDRAIPDVALVGQDEQEVRSGEEHADGPQREQPAEHQVPAAVAGEPQAGFDAARRAAREQRGGAERPAQAEADEADRLSEVVAAAAQIERQRHQQQDDQHGTAAQQLAQGGLGHHQGPAHASRSPARSSTTSTRSSWLSRWVTTTTALPASRQRHTSC
ncbi:hypothetical protein ACFWDZ_17905 [Micromonospora aurantiaca]|uniref:hypothetical protein n=1 Tax=Micromonospora aurantiaca (nom. illeg.) TaxID=47850 RepID=UPI003649D5E2